METQHTDSTLATAVRISAQQIADSKRIHALPRHFGERLLVLESTIYGFLRQFTPQYRGGYWQFYELSNGGFYMAPVDHSFNICVDSNGYEGIMSADAAGITACLFAYSHLSFQDDRDGVYSKHFYQLREFAAEHAESGEIFSAID
jgi:hypothetical protein